MTVIRLFNVDPSLAASGVLPDYYCGGYNCGPNYLGAQNLGISVVTRSN